jgi:hypothetical protein
VSDRRRLTWENNSRDQSCHPRSVEHPETTDQLVELVRRAERENTTVRPVGAGHAWSDVALTDGHLIETDRMSGLVPLDDGTLRDAARDDPHLVRVRGGTRVRALNALLDAHELALRNMGGYDAQSIAGVVATSTHGSGIGFGPFPDEVRSLDLVVSGGELVRVEPVGGITDPRRYAGTLIQDDDAFASAICGIGCLGIVDSLVLRVRPEFWLHETRLVRTWDEVRGELAGGVLDKHHRYELFLDPYARRNGRHEVLVTTRDEVDPPPGKLSKGDGERHPLIEMQSSFPLVWALLRLAARWVPSLMRSQFGRTLRRMEDENYTQVSYRVLNIGAANKLPAYSMELGVPAVDDVHLRTVDRILEIAADCATRGLYHTSPIALRFVAPSRAYASMMYGRPTMMIELILVSRTRNGHRLLAEYERRLAEFDARPHWGQLNWLGRDPQRLEALYPHWSTWLETYARFNASGVFNSEFTDRIGISRRRPA